MKAKIKRKGLKGMTLLEVVIAIAVFAIAASLLVEAALSVIYNVRSSKNIVKKVNYQSKIVACKPDPTSSELTDIGDITFHIRTTDGSSAGDVSAKGYEAKTEVDGDGKPLYQDVAGNLKFFTR